MIDKNNEDIIFFDGLCILCNRTVSLLIKIDTKRIFKYSSLQGEKIKSLGADGRFNFGDSIIFWSHDRVFVKAEAVINILLKLGGVYKLIGLFLKIIPIFILDYVYDLVAKNRYRIFGKNEVCMIPSDKEKDLFI